MNEIIEKNAKQLALKLIVLGFLVAVSWIATLFVWGVLEDRESRQETASTEVAEQWSRAQLLAGPVLTVPIEKTSVGANGEIVVETDTLVLLPKKLAYTGDVATQIRTRGVYDTPVYTADIQGSGMFDLSDIEYAESRSNKILWDKAVVSVNVSDTRGIASTITLSVNGTEYPLFPSSQFTTLDKNGVHANIAIAPTQTEYAFTFDLQVKGSREISFLPLGENTEITLTSNWNAPSFQGQFLPEERTVTPEGFSATWNVASFGTNIPQYWTVNSGTIHTDEALLSKTFGVGLFQEVDFYTMVNRAVKYSILFISLTFLTFFMYEILAGLRIHPLQYLLVGLSIALFYLLLLSFSEIIGFLPAYLVSTTATTLLITGYCVSILKVKKRAFSIMGLLVALYTYLYILLQLEELSLIFGSILLFGVLTTVMYITRNLDWYSLKKAE
jgi:inner membrane protein